MTRRLQTSQWHNFARIIGLFSTPLRASATHFDGKLYALDVATGEGLFSDFVSPNEEAEARWVMASRTVDNGVVYIPNYGDGTVAAFALKAPISPTPTPTPTATATPIARGVVHCPGRDPLSTKSQQMMAPFGPPLGTNVTLNAIQPVRSTPPIFQCAV